MAGDADAAQAETPRVVGAVMGCMESGRGPELGLLVQWVVGALGLPGHLTVGQYDVLCVLDVRNAPTRSQLGGHSGDGGRCIWGSAKQLALGAVGVME